MKNLIYTLILSLAISPAISSLAVADDEERLERKEEAFQRKIEAIERQKIEARKRRGEVERELKDAKRAERESRERAESCRDRTGSSAPAEGRGEGRAWKKDPGWTKTPRDDYAGGCDREEQDWQRKKRMLSELDKELLEITESIELMDQDIARIEERIEKLYGRKTKRRVVEEENCENCEIPGRAPHQPKSGWEVFADVLKAATPLGLGAMGLYGGLQGMKYSSRDYRFYGNSMSQLGLPFAPPSNNYGGLLGAALGPAMWASMFMNGAGGGAGGLYGGPFMGGACGMMCGGGGWGMPYGMGPFGMAAGIGAGIGFMPSSFGPFGPMGMAAGMSPWGMAAGIGAGVGFMPSPFSPFSPPIGMAAGMAPWGMAAGIGAGVGFMPGPFGPMGMAPWGMQAGMQPWGMAAGVGVGVGFMPSPFGPAGMSPWGMQAGMQPWGMAAGVGVGVGFMPSPFGPAGMSPWGMQAGMQPWGMSPWGGQMPMPMPYPSGPFPGYPGSFPYTQPGFPGVQFPYSNPFYSANPSCYGGLCNYNPYMSNMNGQFNNGGMGAFYQQQQMQLQAQMRQLQQQAALAQDAQVAGQALAEAQNRYMSIVSQMNGSYYGGGSIGYGGAGYTQPIPFPTGGGAGGNVTGNPPVTGNRL